jgi:hypothetical protein
MKNGFLSLFICLILAGCNKSNQAPPLTPGYNVYMAGTLDGKAVYWKNGDPVILNDSGTAYSIAVKGSDIYVCGVVNKGGKTFATYWKNGREFSLENQAGSYAGAIAFQGDDVYFAGSAGNLDPVVRAVYWKNGMLNYLSPESQGTATGILVSAQNVYISGYAFSNTSDSAVIWENGQKVFLGEIGGLNAVGTNGADTFYLGTLNTAPTYWKHGKATKLYVNGIAEAMAFSGSDIYFGGIVRPNLSNNYAAIWRNDSLTILTDQYTNSTVSGIAIAGTDVYAVGYVNDEFSNLSAVYWKNGFMVKLGSNGWVRGISVTQ